MSRTLKGSNTQGARVETPAASARRKACELKAGKALKQEATA